MDASVALGLRRALPSGADKSRSNSPSQQYAAVVDPDAAIFERLKGGDREALTVLFRTYAATIRGIGKRILRDNGEADDLVQEVFLYVYRKCALFDESKGTARSWLFQIAYTQAFLRRRKLEPVGRLLSGIADNSSGCYLLGAGGVANYDRSGEGLFGRNGWKTILGELTQDQRETLRLHFFEGLTFSEIAEKLGQSYANIRNHHYRGLERLRRYLVGKGLGQR